MYAARWGSAVGCKRQRALGTAGPRLRLAPSGGSPHQEGVCRVRLLLAVQVAVLLGVPLAAVRTAAALLEQLLQQRVAAAARQTAVRVRLPLLVLPLLLLLLGLGDGIELLSHARRL